MTPTDRIDVYKEWLGIPEGDRPPDNYALLRLVRFEDDPEKIRGNYKKLNGHVRKYAAGEYGPESQSLLNELAKAMLLLTDAERKREYDQSLGREFTEEETGPRTMGQVLVGQGKLSVDQWRQVEDFAEARGISERDALVQMKIEGITAADAQAALAEQLGRAFVDLSELIPEDDILDKMPRDVVKRHRALPLYEERGSLMVAVIDEPGLEFEDEIRLRYGLPLRPVLATPRDVQQGIAKYYAAGMRDEAAAEAAVAGGSSSPKASKSKGKKKAKSKKAAKPASESSIDRSQLAILIAAGGVFLGGMLDLFVTANTAALDGPGGYLFAFVIGLPALIIGGIMYAKAQK